MEHGACASVITETPTMLFELGCLINHHLLTNVPFVHRFFSTADRMPWISATNGFTWQCFNEAVFYRLIVTVCSSIFPSKYFGIWQVSGRVLTFRRLLKRMRSTDKESHVEHIFAPIDDKFMLGWDWLQVGLRTLSSGWPTSVAQSLEGWVAKAFGATGSELSQKTQLDWPSDVFFYIEVAKNQA